MRILGSDFDGTLNYGGIDEAKLSAIEKWRQAGNKFGIVSGRWKHFYRELSQRVPELKTDFFVTCNGAYIMDGNGVAIYDERCTDLPVSSLARDLLSWGCKFVNVIGKENMCIVTKTEDLPSYVSENSYNYCFLGEETDIRYFNQVSVRLPLEEKAAEVVERIKNKYEKQLTPLQNGKNIDIVPCGINKAVGMRRVAEYFGCACGDVITVGDNINDLDMIREFRSYSMANGVEEAKALADGTVVSITELIEKELI